MSRSSPLLLLVVLAAVACIQTAAKPQDTIESAWLGGSTPHGDRTECEALARDDVRSAAEQAFFTAHCDYRTDCEAIRGEGTGYRNPEERIWFLSNCAPPGIPALEGRHCHPSYAGACLEAGIGDYDCAYTEDGPNYVDQVVIVVGPDVFGLDPDGDGLGCNTPVRSHT